MNIKIHSIRFDADQKLLDFIDAKVKKLAHFYDGIIKAEVFLRLENVQGMENKISEIRLEIPGNDLFAKKQSKTFEEATDDAAEALRIQIMKHKKKLAKS
jgi:putative sigma-54 modulation protein